MYAFVTSKLDHCNALLYGLPKYLINRLQLIQNTAARIITLNRKSEHITPNYSYSTALAANTLSNHFQNFTASLCVP